MKLTKASFLFTSLDIRDQVLNPLMDRYTDITMNSIEHRLMEDELLKNLSNYEKESLIEDLRSELIHLVDKALINTIDITCDALGFEKPFGDNIKEYGRSIYQD